jgi:hypothetical protein
MFYAPRRTILLLFVNQTAYDYLHLTDNYVDFTTQNNQFINSSCVLCEIYITNGKAAKHVYEICQNFKASAGPV